MISIGNRLNGFLLGPFHNTGLKPGVNEKVTALKRGVNEID
jgi:hypothetical protein